MRLARHDSQADIAVGDHAWIPFGDARKLKSGACHTAGVVIFMDALTVDENYMQS
jgi:hypothetical protein